MRRNLSLALGLIAIATFVLPAAARRAPVASARRAVVASSLTQKRMAKAGAPSLLVRELDLEGLKKLLRRVGGAARPLLVNFWATWCDPCRDEFPDLVQINKDYKTRGLEFVTVSLDDQSDIKTGVPQFLRQMRATMPAYLLNVPDPEPAIKWVDSEWGGGLPATYLYDARGQVVFKHMGRVNAAELRAAIEKLANGKRLLKQ
ncbi:MAG TPA: TlpA disulfide reductase family protein [Pyrinomonadaceae bacterium]|nr:TlpA disulfide reductase family protein [Pyrinomonadaceae bacterium]